MPIIGRTTIVFGTEVKNFNKIQYYNYREKKVTSKKWIKNKKYILQYPQFKEFGITRKKSRVLFIEYKSYF
jgi:hypothetical protein